MNEATLLRAQEDRIAPVNRRISILFSAITFRQTLWLGIKCNLSPWGVREMQSWLSSKSLHRGEFVTKLNETQKPRCVKQTWTRFESQEENNWIWEKHRPEIYSEPDRNIYFAPTRNSKQGIKSVPLLLFSSKLALIVGIKYQNENLNQIAE